MTASVDSPLSLVPLVGSVVSCAPLLVERPDITAVLYAVGHAVRCVCVQTGKVLGTYEGHAANVVSLQQVHAFNAFAVDSASAALVVSLSDDGKVQIWSLQTFQTVASFSGAENAVDIRILETEAAADQTTGARTSEEQLWSSWSAFCICAGADREFSLRPFDLRTQKLGESLASASHPRRVQVFSVEVGGQRSVAVISARKTELVFLLAPSQQVSMDFKDEISCLSVSADMAAVGFKRGKIEILRGLSTLYQQLWSSAANRTPSSDKLMKVLTRTTLHWHAHAVRCLAFSAAGDQLLSSGDESVLVVWSTAQRSAQPHAAHQPSKFLPRLGAPVTSICAKSTVLVATGDNALKLVQLANMEVTWSWQSLDLPQRYSSSHRLVGLPEAALLGSNESSGTLQLFDMAAKELHNTVRVVHHVRVESGMKSYAPHVMLFAFAKSEEDGLVLATVDEQRGEDLDTAYSLKFWACAVDEQDFVLRCQVNAPHAESNLTALTLRCTDPSAVAVTGAEDGSVKLWRRTANSWRCAYGLQFREAPVHALDLSADLSMLCVSSRDLLTFWDPHSATKVASLTASSQLPQLWTKILEPRKRATAGGGSGRAFLVTASERELAVYDLLTLQLRWTYAAERIKHVAVAEDEDCVLPLKKSAGQAALAGEGWIAVVVHEGKHDSVLFFTPLDATPVARFANPTGLQILTGSLYADRGYVFSAAGGLLYALRCDDGQSKAPTARVKAAQLPSEVVRPNGSNDAQSSGEVMDVVVSRGKGQALVSAQAQPAHKRTLEAFLAEQSQDLPLPSAVSSDFILSTLRTASSAAATTARRQQPAQLQERERPELARPLLSVEEEASAAAGLPPRSAAVAPSMEEVKEVLQRQLGEMFGTSTASTAASNESEAEGAAAPATRKRHRKA